MQGDESGEISNAVEFRYDSLLPSAHSSIFLILDEESVWKSDPVCQLLVQ